MAFWWSFSLLLVVLLASQVLVVACDAKHDGDSDNPPFDVFQHKIAKRNPVLTGDAADANAGTPGQRSTVLSDSMPQSTKPPTTVNSLNTVLLIAVIVAILVCFLLGIFVAFLCFRNMQAAAKDNTSSAFPFSEPIKKGKSPQQGYRNEDDIQLYNYQSRMAQMHANLMQNRGLTPLTSSDDRFPSAKEDYDVIDMPRDSSPDIILGTSNPGQLTSARIVNPVFDAERHGSSHHLRRANSQRSPTTVHDSSTTPEPPSSPEKVTFSSQGSSVSSHRRSNPTSSSGSSTSGSVSAAVTGGQGRFPTTIMENEVQAGEK